MAPGRCHVTTPIVARWQVYTYRDLSGILKPHQIYFCLKANLCTSIIEVTSVPTVMQKVDYAKAQ